MLLQLKVTGSTSCYLLNGLRQQSFTRRKNKQIVLFTGRNITKNMKNSIVDTMEMLFVISIYIVGCFIQGSHSFSIPVITNNNQGIQYISNSPTATRLQTKSLLLSSYVSSSTSTTIDDSSNTNLNYNTEINSEYSKEQKKTTIASVAFLVSSDEYSKTTNTSTTNKSKFGSSSPYGNPSINDAVQHLCDKLFVWSDGTVQCSVIVIDNTNTDLNYYQYLDDVNVLIAVGIQSTTNVEFVSSIYTKRFNRSKSLRTNQCQFILDSTIDTNIYNIPIFTGPYDTTVPSIVTDVTPWTLLATGRRLQEQMIDLYSRWTSDDFCYATLLFINQFSGSNVDWVKYSIDATWEKGPIRNIQELSTMIDKCGDCITECVKDDKCRECITKLTEIDSRDQVTNYRTIVSFESELLESFSRCILTRNNIFGCDATIPTLPKVYPITKFRNEQVTEDIARSILVGHLDETNIALSGAKQQNVSWIVACGANAAYDQFPSQNQIFYPATVTGRDMWYDPVFRVNTLDDRSVWCKRHYKVRPQKVPGTFRFSVLDNGVTSDEFWTIIAVADDLSWIVFHYAGAAKSVGLQYLGGLLCTPDGTMPTDTNELNIIWDHFRSAGIQPWELYSVDNRVDTPEAIQAGPAPLDYYRNNVIASTKTISLQT